jgi:putative salt-induced outer membrane protein
MQKIFILILTILIFPAFAFGQTTKQKEKADVAAKKSTPVKNVAKKKPKYFSGDVHFGMVSNSGNTSDTNIIGRINLQYLRNKWQSDFKASGQFSSDQHRTTAQNYYTGFNTDYYFKKRHFVFGKIDYEYDKFSPYIHTTTLIGGYGWRIVSNKKVDLTFKLGVGPRQQKETTSENIDNDFIIYTSGIFKWYLTDNATFSQVLTVEDGKERTFIFSKTAIDTKIIGGLGLEASYIVKYNSKIPALSVNRYKSDTMTNVVLVYKF